MMKRVLAVLLSVLLACSASGCAYLEPDTITIPGSLLSVVETDSLEEELSPYCQSYTENEDGSVTVVIGKLQHTLVLTQMASSIQATLDESYPSDDVPGVSSVVCSEDFTTATVTLDDPELSTSGLSATLAAVYAYYACSLYQFAAGIDGDEVSTTVCFVDAESNLLEQSTLRYTEMAQTVTVTIPAAYTAVIDMDDIISQLSGYCESCTESEDGSLVIVVNELQRRLLLAYLSDAIQSLLDEMFPNEYIPDLERMTFSDDFTQVTFSVSSYDISLSTLYTYLASFIAYYVAGFYQIAAGVDESDIALTISIADSSTGEVYQEFSLPLA